MRPANEAITAQTRTEATTDPLSSRTAEPSSEKQDDFTGLHEACEQVGSGP